MRRISIFGATGSIGESTFDLVQRAGGAKNFDTIALTGGHNVTRLAQMALELRAQIAVCADESALPALRAALAGSGIECAAGAQAITEAAERPADWVMSAIIGAAGLAPGLRALRHGGTLALANKESLVTAGPLLMHTARQYGATILPVDSEHSAIFQALVGEDMRSVEHMTLTASGGALRDWPIETLEAARLEDALDHPTWSMGARITIDSASMFNKAMEVIETREFFDIQPDMIHVIIHPESLIHALVGYQDGAIMAHLGPHDMRHAIGYALNWPERRTLPVERLNLAKIGSLTFRTPDLKRYPALSLCRDVMRLRGFSGAVFNAAKEVALDLFIDGKIGFMHMARLVECVFDAHLNDLSTQNHTLSLENIIAVDHLARESAARIAQSWQKS